MFSGLLIGTLSCYLLAISDYFSFWYFIFISFASFGLAGVALAAGYVSALSIAASDYTENSDEVIGIMESFAGFGLMIGPFLGGVLYS